MSEEKFSKGEWSLRKDIDKFYWYLSVKNNKGDLHNAVSEYVVSMSDDYTIGGNYEEELIANAYLQFNSKDMYEMLKAAFSEIEYLISVHDELQRKLTRSDSLDPPDQWCQEILHDIQSTLAKARGEQVDN